MIKNGAQMKTLEFSGDYKFDEQISYGSSYGVEVESQPTGQECVITRASGTIQAEVTNVDISCSFSKKLLFCSHLFFVGLVLQVRKNKKRKQI